MALLGFLGGVAVRPYSSLFWTDFFGDMPLEDDPFSLFALSSFTLVHYVVDLLGVMQAALCRNIIEISKTVLGQS